MSPCHTVEKHIEKGNISISSWFDITVLQICIFTPIFSSKMYAKYQVLLPKCKYRYSQIGFQYIKWII